MQIYKTLRKQSLGAAVLSKTGASSVIGGTPGMYVQSHVDGEAGCSQTRSSNSEWAIAQTCASSKCCVHLRTFLLARCCSTSAPAIPAKAGIVLAVSSVCLSVCLRAETVMTARRICVPLDQLSSVLFLFMLIFLQKVR